MESSEPIELRQRGQAKAFVSRHVHVLTALVTLIAAFLTVTSIPTLWKDAASRFGTACNWATIYGLIFTVIEIVRAKNAANLVERASRLAVNELTTKYILQEISECRSLIGTSIDSADRDGSVSVSTLAHISQLYRAEFRDEVLKPDSEHRGNVNLIDSYIFVAHDLPKPERKAAARRLIVPLNKMASDLNAAVSLKIERSGR